MKNYTKTLSAIIMFAMFTMGVSSCSHYKSIQHAETMVDIARNPFIKRLTKSIFKDIASLSKEANTPSDSKIKLTSDLNEVIPAGTMQTFNKLLSTKYHIPFKTVDDFAPTWRKVRDVIGFVGKYGSGFQFYKM